MTEPEAVARREVLRVEDLHVAIEQKSGSQEILHGVSFRLANGEMHGLVGETGSGKSMTAAAITGILPPGCRITGGRICLGDEDIAAASNRRMREICGPRIGSVFQNPRTALYPFVRVGRQMEQVLLAHRKVARRERQEIVLEYLAMAGVPDGRRVADAYPHELSGGLAQRAIIAMALVARPEILIADEPTTGLDVTVQGQILELLADLQGRLGLSVLMITHDLSIVAQYCQTMSVMYRGEVVEDGEKTQVFGQPQVPYTRRLIQASALSTIGREDAKGMDR